MTRTKKIAVGIAVAGAATVTGLLGGVLAGSPAPKPAAPVQQRTADAAGQILAGFSPGDTVSYVQSLESKVAQTPDDGESLALLGLAYQQRARETGDPSFYPLAEKALRQALAEQGDHELLATTGLASLAASRHRFRDALSLARRAVDLSPDTAAPHGVLGDALVELGRYDEAFNAFDRMATLKPNIASYARISYARELLGLTGRAVEAMKLAVDAGSANAENASWTLVQLGHLYFHSGRLVEAAREYDLALERFPGYVHAEAALGRVEAARGNYDRAVELYRRAVERNPLPEFAVGLGDTLVAAGRDREAREAYDLVDVIQRLLEANGVRTEFDTALYDLDHDRDVAGALARVERAYEDRKSVDAEDVLAWAYYENGRCRVAKEHSLLALRLGTKDALKLFHRGMIERCLGHEKAGRAFLARALDTNPYFSLLYAPVAKETVG